MYYYSELEPFDWPALTPPPPRMTDLVRVQQAVVDPELNQLGQQVEHLLL